MPTHDEALTPDWATVESALATVEIPDFWEALPSEDDRVLTVAERTGRKSTFRANIVVVVRPSTETVEQLGARSVAEALALPGWSHVVADKEWLYPGLTGRYVKFLYEASGVCVEVTRRALVTETQVMEVTASCDVMNTLQFEVVFSRISRTAQLKGIA
ncbi:hypothetical protein ACMT9U_10310 [Clavibacter sp. Sh2036]|uniref:hypothetical protein n=1 Tax=Clavibacter sp. Sh2036 TaxID=3397677 RepID=UPI0039E1F062